MVATRSPAASAVVSLSFAASAVVSAASVAAAVVSVLEDVETLHAVMDRHIIAAMPSAIIFFIVVLSSFFVFAMLIITQVISIFNTKAFTL